ncbi:hypothetical protein AYO20_11162 [Fonsecaea nubica]|uniref:Uncharacterized protein n=1 Tax=Fonsecaea nubica TaxID=856822 RepID=A0A178BZP6_9EURO|nr:hypothetical protein AYO20_11162 [Fonsecaea nubica]OAL22674.1 hypothetical protein AYO20_11162 [Fonsecaea nubica]
MAAPAIQSSEYLGGQESGKKREREVTDTEAQQETKRRSDKSRKQVHWDLAPMPPSSAYSQPPSYVYSKLPNGGRSNPFQLAPFLWAGTEEPQSLNVNEDASIAPNGTVPRAECADQFRPDTTANTSFIAQALESADVIPAGCPISQGPGYTEPPYPSYAGDNTGPGYTAATLPTDAGPPPIAVDVFTSSTVDSGAGYSFAPPPNVNLEGNYSVSYSATGPSPAMACPVMAPTFDNQAVEQVTAQSYSLPSPPEGYIPPGNTAQQPAVRWLPPLTGQSYNLPVQQTSDPFNWQSSQQWAAWPASC